MVPSLQKHGLVDAKTTMFPRTHILHNFRFDLALGQVKDKYGFLPCQQQTVHIKFRQFQKFTIRGVSPTGNKRMDMRIPLSQLSKSLDCRNHSRHDILSIQHALNFRLNARPSTRGKFAKQLAIEPSMNSQTFGDGKNHLSVRDRSTNIFGNVNSSQQRPFLVARWAGASLLA
jgi:hypothetical protein